MLLELNEPRRRSLLLALLVLLVPILTIDLEEMTFEEVVVGEVSQHDIRANRLISVVDTKKTEEKRSEAVAKVLPIFHLDMQLSQLQLEKMQQGFEKVQEKVQEPEVDPSLIHTIFQDSLGIHMTTTQQQILWELKYSPAVAKLSRSLLEEAMQSFIMANKDDLPEISKGFDIVRIYANDRTTRTYSDAVLIKSPKDVRQFVVTYAYQYHNDQKIRQAATDIAQSMIAANLSYQVEKTEAEQERVRRSVGEIEQRLQKGEMILRKGEVVTEEHVVLLQLMKDPKNIEGRWMLYLVFSALTGLLATAIYFFAAQHVRQFSTKSLHLETMVLLTIFMLAFGRLSMWLVGSDLIEEEIVSIWYLTPFAGGVMLIRMLINAVSII